MASFAALMLLVAVSANRPVVSEVVPSLPDQGVCTPNAANNWCAPDPATNSRVLDVVRGLESNGWTCSTEPRLVDRVVFQFRDRRVVTMTFDAALEAGRDGLGWSQQFCFRRQ